MSASVHLPPARRVSWLPLCSPRTAVAPLAPSMSACLPRKVERQLCGVQAQRHGARARLPHAPGRHAHHAVDRGPHGAKLHICGCGGQLDGAAARVGTRGCSAGRRGCGQLATLITRWIPRCCASGQAATRGGVMEARRGRRPGGSTAQLLTATKAARQPQHSRCSSLLTTHDGGFQLGFFRPLYLQCEASSLLNVMTTSPVQSAARRGSGSSTMRGV